MKISKYLSYLLKDFFTAFGCLMVIVSIFLSIYSVETIKSTLLIQIALIASAYTFFKYAFANKYELGKRTQLISFTLCSTMADIMIIMWLCFFCPGKIADKTLIIIYIVVVLVIKGMVYTMMYIDGQAQAKQLNEKLIQYNNIVKNKK